MPNQMSDNVTPEGYEVPYDSADVHLRAEYFASVYGDDFFFATGRAEVPAKTTGNFSVTENVTFVLSKKIAWNPAPPPAVDPSIQEARDSFSKWRESHSENFPTAKDVRIKRVAGLQRLSGGGFMFVDGAFTDFPETRIALFRRTYEPEVLTDANGMVSGKHTAEKEMVEEYTPVLLSPGGGHTVLAVKMTSTPAPFTDEQLLSIKRAQEAKIRENLGGYTGSLDYRVVTLEDLPIKTNTLSLIDERGHLIEVMSGSVGFEHDNNTWVYRLGGLLRVPPDHTIRLVDGEFERPGAFYTATQFETIVNLPDALSSTCAFGKIFLKQWPRTTQAPKRGLPRLEQ